MSDVTLMLGDCLELMKALPDGSVDAVITDPPYGTTSCAWDAVIPLDAMWRELKRVAKPSAAIVLFASQPFTTALIASNMAMFRYEWIWHKNYSGGFVSAKVRPMKFHENVVVFYEKQPIYNPIFEPYADSIASRFKNNPMTKIGANASDANAIQGVKLIEHKKDLERGRYPQSVQFFKAVPTCNGIRQHPTEKPVELMRYLVRTYTNVGDTVLDFTMGSGSTGVACVNTQRNFIGMELNADYFAIAQRRIEAAQAQGVLVP